MARPPEGVYLWTDITQDFKASVQGAYYFLLHCSK